MLHYGWQMKYTENINSRYKNKKHKEKQNMVNFIRKFEVDSKYIKILYLSNNYSFTFRSKMAHENFNPTSSLTLFSPTF